MKKSGLILSSVLFSFFIILSSYSFAHDGELGDAHEKGSAEYEKLEEGSGSSAVQSGMKKTEEYKSDHEDEGSFSYKRHRKEMKDKAMQEKMHFPEDAAGKMGEGSGSK